MAIGGTRIKFFKSSPPPGDRRHKYKILWPPSGEKEIEKTSSPRASVGEKEIKKTSSPRASEGEKEIKKDLLASSECRREKIKGLLALSEYRLEQSARPLCVSKLRQDESPQCTQGGGDVTPEQVEAPGKVLLTPEWVQARWSWKVRGVNNLKYGKGGLEKNSFPLEWNANIDLVRPAKLEVKRWSGKVRRGHLTT